MDNVEYKVDEPNACALPRMRWTFNAEGEGFKLAVEAHRIGLAHLFDPMMAVHASNVEPLPHQITAVYEWMLHRQPLRCVLADEPGSGKTIMAGLLIRELLMRADVERVLIVAPGGLVEQWQEEMLDKFGMSFTLFSREHLEQLGERNPFAQGALMVARVDQLARSDYLQDKLRLSHWDLIVVDEAHKLSANYFGHKVNKTKRFQLGELLGSITRHFLLMTATPHNGKEEDFQLFMSLVDPDRFHGRFRGGPHKVEVTDLMRRMVKEDMRRFDGTRLFPERVAHTVSYTLSPIEAELYADVTQYVKEEMNRADRLGDSTRKSTVGFALTLLQRRLASSPAAISRSLTRRREKLQRRLTEEKSRRHGDEYLCDLPGQGMGVTGSDDIWESAEALSAAEYERLESTVADQASAARTLHELSAEIAVLERLEEQARRTERSGLDRKWDELSRLLQTPEMLDGDGRRRKLIVFTEHRDTLDYLARKIRGLEGSDEAVVVIHGGVRRDDRNTAQELFRHDPAVRVMVATDAAGEGVNLQNASLMVNYDLPWNPNRLEQRFGRIHRIGQTSECHLWNMVAAQTREGEVFARLFQKLDVERKALAGRVFDVLGEVFENRSLKDLLIDAIRYGADPDVLADVLKEIDTAMATHHLEAILERNALCDEVMDEARLFAIRDEMEKAEARKLQPYFVRSFFNRAFAELGGELRAREPNRYEITHVPLCIRERGFPSSAHSRQSVNPVLERYERVCFDKQHIRLADRADAPVASLIYPGHPLLQSVTTLTRARYANALAHGAVLFDPIDTGTTPRVLFIVDHAIRENSTDGPVISRRIQFVTMSPDGHAANAGWAPHLDLDALDATDKALIPDVLSAPWISSELEHIALDHALQNMAKDHVVEIGDRRRRDIDKTLSAVNDRLTSEINYCSQRYLKLRAELASGKDVRLAQINVERSIEDLTARLDSRKKALLAARDVVADAPRVISAALVIPAGLLAQRTGGHEWSIDAEARARVERLAMEVVMNAERALGHDVTDVSSQKCGWDITAQPVIREGTHPAPRHIEVKGRVKGSSTVTVSRNEIIYGLNQQDKFLLAIVLVDGEQHEGPFYVSRPFTQEPDWAVSSVNMNLETLLARATQPISLNNGNKQNDERSTNTQETNRSGVTTRRNQYRSGP